MVFVKPTKDCPNAKKIHVLPYDDAKLPADRAEVVRQFLVPYFKDSYRPVHKGDTFTIDAGFRGQVEFKVMAVEPDSDYVVVVPSTLLFAEGDPIKREEEERHEVVGYDDIGGCRKQMA